MKDSFSRLKGLTDENFVIQHFVQQLEEQKTSLEKNLREMQKKFDEAKKTESDFRKVLSLSDSLSAKEAYELERFIKEKKEEIEELRRLAEEKGDI